jgi:hypothetical protein
VDEKPQPNTLVERPPITVVEEEPMLDIDDYFKNLFTEDLSDDNKAKLANLP